MGSASKRRERERTQEALAVATKLAIAIKIAWTSGGICCECCLYRVGEGGQAQVDGQNQDQSQTQTRPGCLCWQSVNHMHNSRREYTESQPIPNNGDAVVSIYKNRERERGRESEKERARRGKEKKIARFNEKSLILLNFHFEKYLRRHSSSTGPRQRAGSRQQDSGPWPWLTKSHVKTHKNNMRASEAG